MARPIRFFLITLCFTSCVLLFIFSLFMDREHTQSRKMALPIFQQDFSVSLNESTCSDKATEHGPHQKVVAFSFFGNLNHKRHYFQGIEANAELIAKLYPGWRVRIYHDFPNNSTIWNSLEDLQRLHNNLDICSAFNIPGFGDVSNFEKMLWRFLPIADPLVDVFVSRDLDSRVTQREVAAVNEWLDTNFPVHVMRDHIYHKIEILGGMWGAQLYEARAFLCSLVLEMFRQGFVSQHYSTDQKLLLKILWPKIQGQVLQHDSFFCKEFKDHGNVRPWPTQRTHDQFNFVGVIIKPNVRPSNIHCPEECRPPNHKDWKLC